MDGRLADFGQRAAAAAHRASLDAGLTEAVTALRRTGVESLLLKGPAVAGWLCGAGEDRPYQGRLVYVPSQNGTVLLDTWQEWDALSAGALWRWSRYANNGNQWPDGELTPLRTWLDIVTSFPNATINGTPGQLVFRAGEPYPAGFTGYLDKVTVGVGAACTTFDFEPSVA